MARGMGLLFIWMIYYKTPGQEEIPPIRGSCADFQYFMCIVLPPAGNFLPLLAESYPSETTKSRRIMTAEGYHHRDSLSFPSDRPTRPFT